MAPTSSVQQPNAGHTHHVVVVVTGLNTDRHPLLLARALEQLAPQRFFIDIIRVGSFLFHDDKQFPLTEDYMRRFIDRLEDSDAVVFLATREAHSVIQRIRRVTLQYGAKFWHDRPCTVMNAPAPAGTEEKPQQVPAPSTRLVLDLYSQSEAWINITNLVATFDDYGRLVDPSLRLFLQRFLESLETWVEFSITQRPD